MYTDWIPLDRSINQERPDTGHAGKVCLEGKKKTHVSLFVLVANLNTDREFAGRFDRGARSKPETHRGGSWAAQAAGW